jgi:2,4-dienoyl-CoA reductase-like NADH-dependent reductase (Old Yellow Enzyme family)
MASVLISPITLRGLTLPNRVVVSPMCQYNSDNRSANDWHLMHLGNMSLGCAGLVMTEMTDVNPQGRSPSFAAHLARLYSRHVRRYWQTVRVTGANSRNREGCT